MCSGAKVKGREGRRGSQSAHQSGLSYVIDVESRLRVRCGLGQVDSTLFDRKVVAAQALAHRGWRLIRSDSEWARSRRLRGRRGERNSGESDDQSRR